MSKDREIQNAYLRGRQHAKTELELEIAKEQVSALSGELTRAVAAPPVPPVAPAPPPPPPAPAPKTLREQLAEIRQRSKPEAAVFALANARGICDEHAAAIRAEREGGT
jgi:hypothetical protein